MRAEPGSDVAAAAGRRPDLSDWLRCLRDGWPALVAATLIGVAAAVVYTARQPTAYAASAVVVVTPGRAFLDPANADKLPAVTATVVRLAKLPPVLERTARRYAAPGADRPALTWLKSRLSVAQEANASLIRLRATAPDQAAAQRLSRAFAGALTATVRRAARTGGGTAAAGIAARTLSGAEPEGKSSPTPVRNLALGGDAGLLVGIVLAVALGLARRRVHRADAIASALDAPLLAELRRRRDPAREGVELTRLIVGLASLAAEPAAGRSRPLGSAPVVLITGLAARGRFESVARAIAAELESTAASGAIVVDPLAEPAAAGRGRRPDDSAPRPAGAAVRARARGAAVLEAPTNGAGRPADVSTAIERVARTHDVVVAVGPALDRTRELLPLLGAADGILLVVRRGLRERELAPLRSLRDGLGKRVLGTIVVG